MLFRIYPNHTYSSIARPRRNLTIPKRYWGFFVKCMEFPLGVVVDRNGIVQPLLKCSKTFPAYPLEQEYDSSENEGDDEFDVSSCGEGDSSSSDTEEEEYVKQSHKRKISADNSIPKKQKCETEQEDTTGSAQVELGSSTTEASFPMGCEQITAISSVMDATLQCDL